MAQASNDTIEAIADSISREMVGAQTSGNAIFVRLPLLYPSGATVVVRVDRMPNMLTEPERFYVSDYAAGYDEAQMMGVATIYVRQGRDIAEAADIEFKDHAFVAEDVARDQLVAAAISVAHCSFESTSVAAQRMDEAQRQADSDILFKRLTTVFAPQNVAKNAEMVGASTTKWPVDVLVRADERETVFDTVTKNHLSIYAATTKFHDMALLDKPPGRVAVVHKKAELKTLLAVLSQAASVVERDVPNSTFERLAARRVH